MATLESVITKVKTEKPNAFTNEHLTKYINELEAIVLHYIDEDVEEYTYSADKDVELTVEAPYDSMYESWLKAKIDFAHEEYQSYSNNQAQFNEDFSTWKAYVIRSGMFVPKMPDKIKNWW